MAVLDTSGSQTADQLRFLTTSQIPPQLTENRQEREKISSESTAVV